MLLLLLLFGKQEIKLATDKECESRYFESDNRKEYLETDFIQTCSA